MSGSLVPFPSARPRFVVDAWPILEWLKNRQPQADAFKKVIERATLEEIVLLMSVVNLGEVYYTSAKEWGVPQAEEILLQMKLLPITIVPASDDAVWSAARLKAVHPISYADAFGASLAIGQSCALITGDVELRKLSGDGALQVEWLGA